jgi:hypothetical protein
MDSENSGKVDNSNPGLVHLAKQTLFFNAIGRLHDARIGAQFLACAERQ